MPSKPSRAASLRASLSHPVIDSDGHWLELTPALSEFLRRAGGNPAAEGFEFLEGRIISVLERTNRERAERRNGQQSWWLFPTKNTLDRATGLFPRLLYERLPEFGIDFTVLYPTTALALPFIPDDAARVAACRAFNLYIAETFGPFADRMTPAAAIPMNTPDEAIAELEHAVGELGLKVVVMGSLIRRTIPRARGLAGERYANWFDPLGLDSEYDYDPVWARCQELKVAPTFHTGSRGFALRVSPSNFTYNHVGHFAAAGEAVCKALFMGGVTRRFPGLRFAFLEGGVGWACNLYSDLIGHWKKRNRKALAEVDPANLDQALLAALGTRYGGEAAAELFRQPAELAQRLSRGRAPEQLDDFAACGITAPGDIRELFVDKFYFGCEADDPINAWAFNRQVNPYQARFNVLFGSDIGHFDVPDMAEVLPEAHELVDEGLISRADFRDFVFANAARFWTHGNPEFFRATAVEKQIPAAL